MSLKSIELQIAIPKTFDAGKIQEQKNQQSMLNQQQAMGQTDSHVQKQRNTVMDSAESEKMKNDKNPSNDEENDDYETPEQDLNMNDIHANHPYKGGFVDYTG